MFSREQPKGMPRLWEMLCTHTRLYWGDTQKPPPPRYRCWFFSLSSRAYRLCRTHTGRARVKKKPTLWQLIISLCVEENIVWYGLQRAYNAQHCFPPGDTHESSVNVWRLYRREIERDDCCCCAQQVTHERGPVHDSKRTSKALWYIINDDEISNER